ncbi:ABC transporter ATP-binding protein [Alteromonas sp. C1M14]|uniref:ABC transporter ATP-binding protein n=1 Tax=Alteromonas sp. C1M14 TaxID=2841567 RepID=UPI002091A530|nr:ABC transporter ATP-binding protein [Alteromonas sp. C1M14]
MMSEPVASHPSFLNLNGIVKRFGDFTAVDGIDLTVKQGEIFALLGSSGCGKSTLLRLLGGFDQATEGQIHLDGECLNGLPAEQRPINMMFQSYALFPHMTVAQNLAYGLKRAGMKGREIAIKVDDMLERVQMAHLSGRKPSQLSGGQQQRVALARALIKGPKLLLLDEPMGALDKKLRAHMQLEITRIIEDLGVTCVMVTHDQEEAMTMADRVAIMDAGRIRQVGTPQEIYEQPNSRFVAEFIGSVNVLRGVVERDRIDAVHLHCAELSGNIYIGHGLTCHIGQQLSVAIRPEKAALSRHRPAQSENLSEGEIVDIAYMGAQSVYHVKLSSGFVFIVNLLNSQRTMALPYQWGEKVWVYWAPDATVVTEAQ